MSDVRWEGYSHEEIYARVQQGPGRLASADAEAAWSTVESTIRTVDAQLTRAVNRIGAGWQGRAADAVHGGMTVMSNWALDAAGDATLTRNGIVGQAEQAARLRAAMPPPRTAEWDRMVHEEIPAVGLMSATGDLGALEERMANDRAVAVDLMNRYSSQSSDNQRMMNFWTQPPTVVVEAVGPGSPTTRTSTGGTLGAAAIPVRPSSPRAGPPAEPAAVGRAGGVAVPAGVSSAGAEPAAAPTTSSRAAPPVVAGSGVPGAVPVPGAAGPAGSGAPATAPRATRRSPSSAEPGRERAVPGTGRAVPGVVARPPATGGPAVPGRLPPGPARAGGLPSVAPPAGGVRTIIPGPPPQAGAADWRTGLRSAPADPPQQPPRPTVPGLATEPPPRPVGMPADGERTAAGRGPGGHGVLPVSGAVRPVDQEHRRPAYLVDDSDAFADDRWIPPPVIGADAQVSHA